jgi:hypothetical protein
MPNKIAAAFLLSSFLLTAAVGQGEWQTFKSTEENFTVSMPREPQQERTTGRTPLGNGHHIYTLDDNGVSFTVSYSVLDNALTQPKDIKRTLDMSRDMVAMVTNGKLLTDTDISIDNFPGRLMRIEKDKRIWTVHAYIVKDRMYQLMTTEPKAKEPNASAAKFFESFHLLHPPE